ncbi:MAG: hypothetical protein PVF57_11980 [Pseudomonadales bacterium]
MKVVVKTDEYTIYQKRNERYAVKDASRAWVNGEAKVAILLEHKLIEAPAPKAPEPEPAPAAEEKGAAEEATGEEAAPEETTGSEAAGEEATDASETEPK